MLSLILNKPTTLPPGRLFGHISVAYACLQFSFLLFKACMLVTSTSFKTGIKLHGLSLLLGVKQGCPLSPLLFSLYIDDIGTIAEGVQGAVTGTEDVRVTHMCADDLTLLANTPDAMQTMQNRLVVYARSKHLTINTAKSEVVHFNSKRGAQVPTFMLTGAALKCSDSFKYLGMTYHRTLNMTASSEQAAIPMLAAAHQIRGFVRDTALCDKPSASLWLAKAYVVPAGM